MKQNSKQKENKLHINPWRIVLIFVVLFLIFDAIFYFSFQSQHLWPLETSFYIYTPALLISSAFFCFVSITQTYYLVDKEKITHSKMGKTYVYYFKDILYIDEEWSTKHKMLLFYGKDGIGRYLAWDKEGKIYQAAMEKSHLISREEYITRYPNAKM